MIRENKLYGDLTVGESATLKRVVTAKDLYVFAHASGNLNHLHLPEDETDDIEAVAPSMWVGALISAVLGNILPGPGCLYREQSLSFDARARVGDELTVTVTVAAKLPDNLLEMETHVTGRAGAMVAKGRALVEAPTRKVTLEDGDIPELLIEQHRHFDRLLAEAEPLPPLSTVVAAPEDEASIGGALLGMKHNLIVPIFVGNAAKIRAAAEAAGDDISGIEIIDVPDHGAAASRAVKMVREGAAGAIMKGHMHTADLLSKVVKKETGLRTNRRLSHIFVLDVPGLPNMLIVTDAGVNILPDLVTKVDITQNAINLALSLGIEQPKVGILSAVETVTPTIPSTIDAAALSKMQDRGQITGGLVDGPLAMDNAIDLKAAQTKGIRSLVAGRADVLVVPNLEAGNMLAKELNFAAHAEAAGVVVGAQVPIILTSRADGEKARLASCAVAVLHHQWRLKTGRAVP